MRPTGRRWRLLARGVLVLLIAPVTWFGRGAPPENRSRVLRAAPLALDTPAEWPPQLRLAGAWHLTSENSLFGSYSALLMLPGGRLRAYSDRGNAVTFAAPPAGGPATFEELSVEPSLIDFAPDIESATRDPASGTIWLGYESWNGIRRLSPDGGDRFVRPPEMELWPTNGSTEAIVRLADGRFLVLRESSGGLGFQPGEGLLFAADPLAGGRPIRFGLPQEGYQPTDMAQLPDGRVLILLRTIAPALPPFRTRLVLADPDEIAAGSLWQWRALAPLASPLPQENYEGLAIEPLAGGRIAIWLIADDNRALFQRTILLRLVWDPL